MLKAYKLQNEQIPKNYSKPPKMYVALAYKMYWEKRMCSWAYCNWEADSR